MGLYYHEQTRILVSVDCIIFGLNRGELSLLIIKRNLEPEKGKWSLMGGFVQENESLDEAARRVLMELTGLRDVYMEQVGAFGAPDRDPGERVISVAYYALINFDDQDASLEREHNAKWIKLNEIPPLGFDHPLMIKKAMSRLRRKFSLEPIVFNLLPEYFTLSQLQSLYETILGEPVDKRNFRKRIAEMRCIEKTDLIDKTTSRRGASLYKFNNSIYESDKKFNL